MEKLPTRLRKSDSNLDLIDSSVRSGQALLLVLLSMTVILTVTLSVASRSVVDVATTTYEENAMRAFSAAEAGVEQALLTGLGGSEVIDTQVTFDTTVTTPSAVNSFNYPALLSSGESAVFWFVSHDSDGNLSCTAGDCLTMNVISNLCWGEPGTYTASDAPAVELTIYYDDDPQEGVASGDFSNTEVVREAYDYFALSRGNGFNDGPVSYEDDSDGSCEIDGKTYSFSATNLQLIPPRLNVPCRSDSGCLLMAKVMLLYSGAGDPHSVGMEVQQTGGTQLPAQGMLIESIGEAGESTRKVRVFQGYPELPDVIGFSAYSTSSLVK
jgi:hypothetical protein